MAEPEAGSDSPDIQQPDAGNLGAAGLAQLQAQLAEAQEQIGQHKDQMLRVAAELDNIRKRAARDVEQAHRYALEKFAQELLPVRDSLELAVANATRADAASLVAGQEATLQLLARAFDRFSIRGLDPQGEPFDPARHEAIAMRESDTAEPQSVLDVVQRGYELNGRLLRPARVVVARSAEST
jgi:molecular chaperone GrpE